MSADDELTQIITSPESFDGGPVSCGPNPVYAARTADAIRAAGYRKPSVLGYIVVDRGGVMVGNQHKHRESAQEFADEWTADCKTAGIDWEYRVAEIVEAQS